MAGGDRAAGRARLRRLAVHVGAQKTGSTALHQYLQRNRERLAPALEFLTPASRDLMAPLGQGCLRWSLDPSPAHERALRQAIRRAGAHFAADDPRPALLSHENLAGAMPGCGHERGLYPRLPQIVGMLREELSGLDLEVVLTTRRMAAWKRSVWGQAVRSDAYRGSLDDFLAETAAITGWDDLVARLAAALGPRLTVLPIEDEADPARPGLRLLRRLGVPDDILASLRPLDGPGNPALSPAALEFIRALNGADLPAPARRRVVELVAARQSLFAASTPPAGDPAA